MIDRTNIHQAVQIGIRRALAIQVAAANVAQGFVGHLVSHANVLKQRVRAQHGVVRVDHRGVDRVLLVRGHARQVHGYLSST